MNPCPHCQRLTPAEGRFCQQCGKPLGETDLTVFASPSLAVAPRTVEQQFDLSALFGAKGRLLVGRSPDCDIRLPHPTVSRYHARFERRGDAVYLLALPNVNGVWLNGHPVGDASPVREGDRVIIGPYLLTVTRGGLRSLDNSRGVRLEARGLQKEVPLPDGGRRLLLDGVDLIVQPGEFVTLLGPSGSGKSTLMDCLNGRRRATAGRVIANGEDFYENFDSFRQSLGYVPQKDIVHTGLSVRRALYYTARLRLPPDTDRDELLDRVEQVIRQMELGPHRDTLVGNLSGGQIKRVSLGAELLAEPSLLYIDEATSGLDAGTEARMMRLFRELADEGRSVLCITHNVDSVDRCHLVLVLARGKLIYYGPPAEAPRYFGVARISEIYDRIAERDADEWRERFAASGQYAEYVDGRIAAAGATPSKAEREQEEPPRLRLPALFGESKLLERVAPLAEYFRRLEAGRIKKLLLRLAEGWNQFRVLTLREVELIKGDPRTLRLLLLQAPVVAMILLLGFVGKNYRAPMPRLRHLEDHERNALRALRALGQLTGDKPLTAEQKAALRRVQVRVTGDVPVPVPIDGNTLVAVLRRLVNDELSPQQRQVLEATKLKMDVDGEPIEVSLVELARAWREFHRTDIPDRLLHASGPVVPLREPGVNPRFSYILLFVLVMIVMWFGCNNAAKEIVKEAAVYGRERAVNLGIVPYLASKFLVLGAITTLHVLLLMLMLYGVLEGLAHYDPTRFNVPDARHMLGYGGQFGVLVLVGLTGVALGLLLSACVTSPDRANALLPYVLIPQMILGGGILSVTGGPLYYLAVLLSPVYWGYRAVHLGADQLPPNFPGYAPDVDGVLWPCVGLVAQLSVLLTATFVAMRRKDAA